MLASKWKRAMLGIASIGVLSVAANAEVYNNWLDPCGTTLDCLFNFCWCEDQWDTVGNWSRGNVPEPGETAHFKEENFSNSCPLGNEDWLQANLTNSHTMTALLIEVTSGSGNKLRIALVGNNTLTCTLYVEINATNGPILFEVADGARVLTQ